MSAVADAPRFNGSQRPGWRDSGFTARSGSDNLRSRHGGGGRREPFDLLSLKSTMIILGIVLAIAGIGLLCWLLFTLAVYALPFFAGLTAGLAAYHSGAGVVGAIIVAVVGGVVTFAIAQVAFARARRPLVRAAIGLLYTAPAAIAGYGATLGMARITIASEGWRQAIAVVGALLVAGSAVARLASLNSLAADGRGGAQDPTHHSLTAGQRVG
jgi:MFS family permease